MVEAGPLVWIDCEMTGLDSENDTILEIACIITDGNLNILASGPEIVIHHPKHVLDAMNEWCVEHHGKSRLTARVLSSTVTMEQAEATVLDLVKSCCAQPRVAVLAGNSVHVDCAFLRHYMPKLVEHLHYRIVDVSSVKELARRWNPNVLQMAPAKNLSHRALDDIIESIEELRYYREKFFVCPSRE
ncbi:Phosphatidylinositol 3,4,5-trisphosphate-dependent Rac exchanger 2 protein [Coemansia sp. RSA 922]|nr:rna exonuclease [Coemansia sp. S3946]KAJ2107729.1 Phosphatidylinositol 3,4,5-trisphosphate-dependent Rac exchanger 2 protein [Coemansia sp. RSA 922]